jgi:hypothetical protein
MIELKTRIVDDESSAVAGELSLGRRRMQLPGRLPTSSEVRAARGWKLLELIDSPVLIVARLMSMDLLQHLKSEEEAWQRFSKGVGADLRSMPEAARILYLSFRSVEFDDVDLLRTFLALQHILGFDPGTVQSGTSPSADDLASAFSYARSWARERGVEHLMPITPPLDTREEALRLMRSLLNRGASALGLDLQGRFPYQTLRAVEELKGESPEVWVHAFQAPPKVRIGRSLLHASQGMVLPYYGVDSFSRWIVPPPPQPVRKERVNFFDPRGWGVLKGPEHRDVYGDELNCRCRICRGKSLDEFMSPDDRGFLNLAKVHDHFSQSEELSKAAERMEGVSYRSMLAGRSFTRSFLERVSPGEREGILPKPPSS